MEAGIATEDNLVALREKGFDYLCVSRSDLREYSIGDSACKTMFDRWGNPVEISMLKSGDNEDGDLYLYVKSAMKGQ